MELVCHSCSATVEPDSSFCQNCGAPQIHFVPRDEADDSATAGLPSVPSALPEAEYNTSIQWQLAIKIAASVAAGVGLLSTLLAAGSVLWVAIGAIVAIGMYHRRQPRVFLGRKAGARIGGLVGLLTAAVALAGNAIFLVVQRYGLHEGNQIDSQLTGIVTQAADRAAAIDPQAPVTMFTSFWLSAEGRIGLILLTMGFLATLILLFAIAGGVLGAQIYRSPRGRKTAS